MNYSEWEQTLTADITNDSLWKMEAYRLSLFLSDLAWPDVKKLAQERSMLSLSDQLYRAVGSIGANMAEGYSRSSGKDRVRFYEYSLGSARESRDWYFKSRHALGETVALHRIHLITQITRLLLTMIPDQRHMTLKEDSISYDVKRVDLLIDIPMPHELT